LWRELEGRFRTFTFPHSWGLGVLEAGRASRDTFLDLLFSGTEEQRRFIRHYYGQLARVVSLENELARLKDEISRAAAEVNREKEGDVSLAAGLARVKSEKDDALVAARAERHLRTSLEADLARVRGERDEALAAAGRERGLVTSLEAELASARNESEVAWAAAKEEQLGRLELVHSQSWRVTAPLRWIYALIAGGEKS
jgi:chromosome segregation ATPase